MKKKITFGTLATVASAILAVASIVVDRVKEKQDYVEMKNELKDEIMEELKNENENEASE